MQGLQARQTDSRAYEYTSLLAIEGCSSLPRGTSLFDSIVVFENYPAVSDGAANVKDLTFFEKASYPVTVIARPGDQLNLSINFDPRTVNNAMAIRLLKYLEAVFEQIARNPDWAASSVQVTSSADRIRMTREWNQT